MTQRATIKGFDFTSSPRRKKPITCGRGVLAGDSLQTEGIDCLTDFEQFENALQEPGPWIAGFDFPFSLPKIFVEQAGWPLRWEDMVWRLPALGQSAFESTIRSYCAANSPGNKHPRRRTDVVANSRSPLMLDYTPVGKMFFQGSWRLANAGLCIAPCRLCDDNRIAVEVYPALVARRWIQRLSYKSDTKRKQTANQAEQRRIIVQGLRGDRPREAYGCRVVASDRFWDQCISDPGADLLDAVLCCVQAAWAYSQRGNGYGIPSDADRLEGWIIDPSTAQRAQFAFGPNWRLNSICFQRVSILAKTSVLAEDEATSSRET